MGAGHYVPIVEQTCLPTLLCTFPSPSFPRYSRATREQQFFRNINTYSVRNTASACVPVLISPPDP
jgi:hypothetical protein